MRITNSQDTNVNCLQKNSIWQVIWLDGNWDVLYTSEQHMLYYALLVKKKNNGRHRDTEQWSIWVIVQSLSHVSDQSDHDITTLKKRYWHLFGTMHKEFSRYKKLTSRLIKYVLGTCFRIIPKLLMHHAKAQNISFHIEAILLLSDHSSPRGHLSIT